MYVRIIYSCVITF